MNFLQVYKLHLKNVETFPLPPLLQIFGFEQRNSLACPQYIAAVTQIFL